MPAPISRYRVPGFYVWAGLAALGLTSLSGWMSLSWPLCWIATGLFLGTAAAVLFLASRPAIEIYESHLKIGQSAIPWRHIRRVDRSMNSPLTVRLALSDKSRMLVVYPGDPNSSASLLRQLRKHAHEALIDGVPYRQFWGESTAAAALARQQPAAPRPPLLLPDDEADVERMYQRLKSVGHLDQKTSSEDK